jgi:hypothetical protein
MWMCGRGIWDTIKNEARYVLTNAGTRGPIFDRKPSHIT